ncbi:hydrolase, alpha/beta domain protein [Kitasatospora cheerisanensis KCTC 2395]|uniref:Hydrolase, alpha/beta domain protein n=2 Tax=Kitasatospora cheerisanensis TaxID=81942 RepID=A0A066YW15_9ACTN|nr:hydrolase, alpha/beta domain protein [Kitasatospora cheerisanensis KCTC 2395]
MRVPRCGRRLRPRSRSPMARSETPEASASSSMVRPRARRSSRRVRPKPVPLLSSIPLFRPFAPRQSPSPPFLLGAGVEPEAGSGRWTAVRAARGQGVRGPAGRSALRGKAGRARLPSLGPRRPHRLREASSTMSDSHTAAGPLLEPEARAFADATADPPYLFDLGPAAGREAVDQVQSGETALPAIDEEWIEVAGGPAGPVRARIVRPAGATGTLPVVLYIHGAGWVFGNAHTHDRLVRELAVGAGAAVVFPEYDLSPEARYPVAVEQNYAVARWVVTEGRTKGLDAARLAVAGDSVGGNMAAALTLMAKARGDVALVQQVLFYPVTDAAFDTDSYREFATGYFLRRDAMQWFWDQYTTDPAQRAEITASPLRATVEQLTGLPPALVVTGEADVLRDEGEAYAVKLRRAGVPVTAVRFLGTIHDFVMLNALRPSQSAQGAVALAVQTLRQALHQA